MPASCPGCDVSQFMTKTKVCVSWLVMSTYRPVPLVGDKMMAIEELSGILDHTVECNDQIKMDCDPPLHPILCEYALTLC